MFEKINYIAIAALFAALAVMIQSSGKLMWYETPRKDFYAIAAQTNVSEAEKKARIKEKYGDIEKLIEAGTLEKAMQKLLQMEPANKTDGHLHFLKGRIYAQMKLYKESITSFLKAVKYDPDYVDEGCALYKGTLIKEVTLDALEHFKGKAGSANKAALKLVYAMQRRLAGSCE